jgi:transposase
MTKVFVIVKSSLRRCPQTWGETDPAALAGLADHRLRAQPAQLRDALGACAHLHPVYRRLLQMALEELKLLEEQIEKLDREAAELLQAHRETIQRLAEVPGLGVSSAVQIIAEVGPEAEAFESAKESLRGWRCVRGATRLPARPTARHRLRAIGTCGGC